MATPDTPGRIRRAVAADVPPLAALFYDTVMHHGPEHYTAAQTQAWAQGAVDRAAFAQFLAPATVFVMEAERDEIGAARAPLPNQGGSPSLQPAPQPALAGDLLGFAGVAADGHVVALYVRRDRLRQGIGARLLQTLIDHGAAAGLPRLYGEASAFSLGLFLKFGFRQGAMETVERHGVIFHRYPVERVMEG